MTIKPECAIRSVKHDLSELKYPAYAIIASIMVVLFLIGYSQYLISLMSAENTTLLIMVAFNSIIVYESAFEFTVTFTGSNSKKLVHIALPLATMLGADLILWAFYTLPESPRCWPSIVGATIGIFIISVIATILLRAYARCRNGEDG